MKRNHFQGHLLNNLEITRELTLPKPDIGSFKAIGDYIVGKVNGCWVVYDRICDHNGGQLCLDHDGLTATCPLHRWTLKLDSGEYENGCKKKSINFEDCGENLVIRETQNRFPEIAVENLTSEPVSLLFNAHASVTIDCAGVKLSTDPWLSGPCFATGWWHSNPPSIEAIARVKDSDYIFISHNHSDHLHPKTLLENVSFDTPLIVPNFKSESVRSVLQRLGYTNLLVVDFNREFIISTDLGNILMIVVKSGDDRDDSSLFYKTKDSAVFLAVDTNRPNNWILPPVDILYTPFASGASGFPCRVDNFSDSEKYLICEKNRRSFLTNHVHHLVEATSPKVIVPYAGYFTESFYDQDVTKLNVKNSPGDLAIYIAENFPGKRVVDPCDFPVIRMSKGEVNIEEQFESPAYFVDGEYVKEHSNAFFASEMPSESEVISEIAEQLVNSTFYDELTIVILLTDRQFNLTSGRAVVVDLSFSSRGWDHLDCADLTNSQICQCLRVKTKNRIEILRFRSDSLYAALARGLPLEDLSIGFQVRMYRDPNIYNFAFWDHFTNKAFLSFPQASRV